MMRDLICFHAKTKRSARKCLRMSSKGENCTCFLSRKFPVMQYFMHMLYVCFYNDFSFFYLECQTNLPWDDNIQTQTIVFAPRAQFEIHINDDRFTRYYTGMSTFDLFIGLVEYLEQG